MKKSIYLFVALFAVVINFLVYSCKKDSSLNTTSGISTSFTEEFDSVYKLESKGWGIHRASSHVFLSGWKQGFIGPDKGGVMHGFPAYSYTTSPDEFAYAQFDYGYYSSTSSASEWLITPVLAIKNGDKISFYTRADTGTINADRLQVLMNKSTSKEIGSNPTSVGVFTTTLLEINATQVVNGYPTTWTKYEYTFSGINGKIDTRVAFRYFIPVSYRGKGIGIDQFTFTAL